MYKVYFWNEIVARNSGVNWALFSYISGTKDTENLVQGLFFLTVQPNFNYSISQTEFYIISAQRHQNIMKTLYKIKKTKEIIIKRVIYSVMFSIYVNKY